MPRRSPRRPRPRPRGRDRKAAAKTRSKTATSRRRPQAADREQALHAEGATQEEDPQAHRVSPRRRGAPSEAVTSADPIGRVSQGSINSADRSSCSTSARRRTSERAVGSSPSARSTSTSVTIPMTVE